jgi:prepilin-type N-terminal cleavage/methylation domain-containing protein
MRQRNCDVGTARERRAPNAEYKNDCAPRSALDDRRAAYTLLELMLVLAIIVVMAAIAYPSATAMYGHLRLSQAADTVREAWAQARSHAIDEGRPYRFAIIPNEGNYRVAPDSPEFWGSSAQEQPSADAVNPPYILSETLPKGLRFSAPEAPSGSQAQGESSIPKESISPDMWSSRTVFLPDGTARQDVEIVFGASGTMGIVMKLRALTGAVTVKSRKLP